MKVSPYCRFVFLWRILTPSQSGHRSCDKSWPLLEVAPFTSDPQLPGEKGGRDEPAEGTAGRSCLLAHCSGQSLVTQTTAGQLLHAQEFAKVPLCYIHLPTVTSTHKAKYIEGIQDFDTNLEY